MVRRVRLAVLLGLVAAVAAQEATPAGGGGEEGAGGEGGGDGEVAASTRPPLTGNPQIDYKYDPNLPHELIGYDLSDYPFYNKLPKDLLDPSFNFTCEGRHDGFYASIPHKCQVYHNCLFSQRYDFLCANYTVFDQKNFICHYVSEVDCLGSEKHYDRNDELYETTTTTTTTQAPPQIIYVNRPRPLRGPGRIRPKNPRRPSFGGGGQGGGGGGGGGGGQGGKRRPGKRRRTTTTTPPPDYYDYDYDYDYYDYYDYYGDYNEGSTTTTTTTTPKPRRRGNRPRAGNRPRQGGAGGRQSDGEGPGTGGGRPRGGGGGRPGGRGRPRSRNNQAGAGEPIDDTNRRQQAQNEGTRDAQPVTATGGRRRRPSNRPRPKINLNRKPSTTTTTTTTTEAAPEYYYDDYYDYAEDTVDTTTTTTTTTTPAPGRRVRPSSRARPRGGSGAADGESTSQSPSGTRRREGSRVSVRKTQIVGDRGQTEDEETQAETAPVRQGPRFPSRRGSTIRNEPQPTQDEAPAIEEEAAVETAAENQSTGRRRGSNRQRPVRPSPAPPKQDEPEYYYDDY